MKKAISLLLSVVMIFSLAACGSSKPSTTDKKETTLVYGSGDYTRINPAMDEHGEINTLIFNGLTAHDGENKVVPALAKSWEFDKKTCTYTFHMEENAKWHDGKPVTAEDVKFTIEAIMDPENESENAPNFEDVKEIKVIDKHTIAFKLADPNVAFLDYMTMAVLPKHLLEGKNMQEDEFFRKPVGTGPYKLASWDKGQSITLVKNEDYFKEEAKIDKIIFKIVTDDNAKTLQVKSGELDLALLTPKDAKSFKEKEGYTVYNMKTSDYRGIMFNFQNEYWKENKDIIPAICYGLDRKAILNSVVLGQGIVAYGPLQRNQYNNENVEHYDYNETKAKEVLESVGCTKGKDGFYYRNNKKLGFTISVGAGDQVRLDMAQAAAQQLKKIGIDVKVEVPSVVDWSGQQAYLIGWGSPFDADDHTYKVFGTDKGANYSGYSNKKVDQYLKEARESDDSKVRAEAYNKFQVELAKDPAYAFICYIDADYVAKSTIKGIDSETVMGHHGVGIFWNVTKWTITK
ncbi:oligopeptide ABC transporter, periplasmic oligopeptide-binding protein OppA [Lachnospiraceae bacterium KM106-2]|nr:oligopeptide ABC transporter, periplasmic oligopeptide-binding protein OppA [Lachnospiraceae bacterium KM106-2]